MQRPGGERAAFGSSSSRTARGAPVTTSQQRCRGAFASKARASYLARTFSIVNVKHRSITDELRGVQCAGCLRQRQRVQRATSAQHSSAKRPSAHRARTREPSASIIKDREAAQTKRSRTKGPHGREAGHRDARWRAASRRIQTHTCGCVVSRSEG